jgi:hypothetical protein
LLLLAALRAGMVMHRGKDVDKVSTMLRPTARLQDTFAHLVPEPRGPCLEHLNMNGFFATPVMKVYIIEVCTPCIIKQGCPGQLLERSTAWRASGQGSIKYTGCIRAPCPLVGTTLCGSMDCWH